MKMMFRWYGEDDPVTLRNIAQIPNVSGIVSAVYKDSVGELWTDEHIEELKEACNQQNLSMEVIESLPVHEDIKLKRGDYKRYIENYKINIRMLAKHGVKCICYNFMPVFDWTRTELDKELKDGSTVLAYDKNQLQLDSKNLEDITLPGWDASYTTDELRELMQAYAELNEEGLWSNLEFFLQEIIPVAKECDVRMAIHPDDPPWPIYGLPRIITCEKNIDKFLSLYDSEYNGLTICTGSLGCTKKNDVVAMCEKYSKMKRIHFVHVRNVRIFEDGLFEESAHYSSCGSLDIVKILRTLHDNGFDGYIRPDHGRMIWGEVGKPGYGLFDRALGSIYISGIWETLDACDEKC